MRLDVVDARRRQPFGLLCGFGRRVDVDAAEADLHRAAGGRRGRCAIHGPLTKHARTDDLALVDAVADGQARLQRRPEVDCRS